MKKIFLALVILMFIFTGCDDTDKNNISITNKTTLTITNSTDFNGIQPYYGDVDFGMMNRGQKVTKEVEAGTNYIFIMLTAYRLDGSELLEHTSMWDMADIVVCEEKENTTLTITNNTTVIFSGGNSGYLSNGGQKTGSLKTVFDAYIKYNNEN